MLKLRLSRATLGLALFFGTTPLLARAQTYPVKQIRFSDLGAFTQRQLEDAVNIHSGTPLTPNELGAAAKRLAETGYFDDVSATIDSKTGGVTVLFDAKPTPAAGMLHVGFENLIWLTPDEITKAIKTKVPLFTGYLPDNSPREDDLEKGLVEALAAKSIKADVACDDVEPTLLHPRREIACGIVRPALFVSAIKLSGVTPSLAPLVQKSVNSTARTPYTEGPADLTTADRILAPLLDAGYLQATLADVKPSPAPLQAGNLPVVLSAKLVPGEIFHVSEINFAGTPLLSAASFQTSAKLHPGDVASRAALLQTLTPLDAAYRDKGYMDVVVKADPAYNDTAHTVAYNVSVEPGEQYRLHEITADNLDPKARADFDRGFLLKPGDLYNPDYVATFLKRNTALRALAGYSANFKATSDPNTHLVDLLITFIHSAH